MITGPLYALVAVLWTTAEDLEALIGPQWTVILNAIGTPLSYIAVTLFGAGVPLLFPTGSLPGRRWRVPVGILTGLLVGGMAAAVTHPGPLGPTTLQNPFGIPGWPPVLQVLENMIPVAVLGLLGLGLASQVIRYRRGTEVERLQVRWLAAAVAVVVTGFVGVFIEMALRTDPGPLLSALVAYVGILLMPIAIGIAILRYRLYEIDRLISRTIGWAVVTGILAAVFVGLVVTLQAVLASITSENTLAVAASTLVAFALFQPLRRRVQRAVDRRFDRARYDGDRVVGAFSERLRGQIDLGSLDAEIVRVARETVNPSSTGVWLRNVRNDSSARPFVTMSERRRRRMAPMTAVTRPFRRLLGRPRPGPGAPPPTSLPATPAEQLGVAIDIPETDPLFAFLQAAPGAGGRRRASSWPPRRSSSCAPPASRSSCRS